MNLRLRATDWDRLGKLESTERQSAGFLDFSWDLLSEKNIE